MIVQRCRSYAYIRPALVQSPYSHADSTLTIQSLSTSEIVWNMLQLAKISLLLELSGLWKYYYFSSTWSLGSR